MTNFSNLSLFIVSLLFLFDVYAIYLYNRLTHLKHAFAEKKTENIKIKKQLVFSKKWAKATEEILMKAVRITQEKRDKIETQKIQLKEQNTIIMAQNDRLREIADLHSHKVRQPTASILGLCSIINSDTLTEENRLYFEMIKQSAINLDDIIHEIVRHSDDENQV